MKTLIILGQRHGSSSVEVVSGPEVPYYEQRKKFREFLLNRAHPTFATVELHGVYREQSIRLAKPGKKAAPAAPVAPPVAPVAPVATPEAEQNPIAESQESQAPEAQAPVEEAPEKAAKPAKPAGKGAGKAKSGK